MLAGKFISFKGRWEISWTVFTPPQINCIGIFRKEEMLIPDRATVSVELPKSSIKRSIASGRLKAFYGGIKTKASVNAGMTLPSKLCSLLLRPASPLLQLKKGNVSTKMILMESRA